MAVSDILRAYLPLLPEETLSRFDIIAERLVNANEKFNLTAITDEKGIALLHVFDSLTLLETGLFTPGKKIIDVGCGGGFPALPLAAALPGCELTANDSTLKKLDFVLETAKAAGCNNLGVLPGRAEELGRGDRYRESFDIAVSRGVARLNVLCEWCLPFVKEGGYFVAMKGEKWAEESARAENAVKTLGGIFAGTRGCRIPGYGYEHTLVIIEKTRPTPPEYPRANGRIMKRPL